MGKADRVVEKSENLMKKRSKFKYLPFPRVITFHVKNLGVAAYAGELLRTHPDN